MVFYFFPKDYFHENIFGKDIKWICFADRLELTKGEAPLTYEIICHKMKEASLAFRGRKLEGVGKMADRILLVEDDLQIAEVIRDYFERHENSYEIDHVDNGTDGIRRMQEQDYVLILLDVMLPGRNGFSVLRELRRTKDVPVIFITAKVREEDRLLGYELGCDDYVCKPFSLAELYAKVKALINRAKGTVLQDEIICGAITINSHTLEVRVGGAPVELTPKELDLLMTLIRRKNWIFSREALLDLVWGDDYEGTDRTVDNHVKKLRKRLGAAGAQIKTIYSKGYKISDQ